MTQFSSMPPNKPLLPTHDRRTGARSGPGSTAVATDAVSLERRRLGVLNAREVSGTLPGEASDDRHIRDP